jgi:hypothetical protein
MPSADTTTHSFIVTLWLEEPPSRTSAGLWRGRITHVPSGENRYFQELNGINRFIQPYLPESRDSISPESIQDRIDQET